MPNWVYNSIEVRGSKEDIKSFLAKAERGEGNEFRQFSFWNFVTPPLDHLDEYHETNGWTKDPATGEMVQSGNTPFNWYNWNIENWGTKWDACSPDIEQYEETSVIIRIDTAWDKPDPVFVAMTEQHPELSFDFEWEEEQGWGGRAVGVEGKYRLLEEWDIPNSHADYVALGRSDSCNCNTDDDQERWFSDCPPLTEQEIETKRRLNAYLTSRN